MNLERPFSLRLEVLIALSAGVFSMAAAPKRDYPYVPVPFNRVEVNDPFWTPRLEVNRTVTIPYAFLKCEETGRIRNFEKAAGLLSGKHEGIYFNDSDVYKVMEGAAYALQVRPDTMLRLYLDKVVTIMAAAQWEDGYLYTFFSIPKRQPQKRWTNIRSLHELYCMGHMYEAAVAHWQVTGTKKFLNVAVKSADLVCRVFGPGKRTDPPGHQEIEIALCKLYRATGDAKYLQQAKFFLDQRGRLGNRGPDGRGGLYGWYSQDHKPVVEQREALGHAVRAAYMYCGMADVAALTGNRSYIKAIDAIWGDVVGRKLYVTGGIGAAGGHEGFGPPYELPNETAYCETCASIAMVLWSHRMFLLHGDAEYIDILERTLYNAALSGVSMKGDRFFYPNPLASRGKHARSPWFGCACCPSNIARFIPSVPGFAYATRGKDIFVNLFISGKAELKTGDNTITLRTKTRYPWEGKVNISVQPRKEESFTVFVRIPLWARNRPVPTDLYRFLRENQQQPEICVNGAPVPLQLEKGYAAVQRTWKAGDTLTVNFPLPVRRVVAHPKVAADKGRVALQRGPIVFCLEGPDNGGEVFDVILPDDADLKVRPRPDLLGGIVTITGEGKKWKVGADGRKVVVGSKKITAIPYYAWAHRGRAQMTVWIPRVLEAARP